jgi:hypothetical protein
MKKSYYFIAGIIIIAIVGLILISIYAPTKKDCILEGKGGGVYPGMKGCCKGLTAIGCDRPNELGKCLTSACVGGFSCTKCGDNECGLGENKCNCPKDCNNSCNTDTDCSKGEFCSVQKLEELKEFNLCVVSECENTNDCRADEYCSEHICYGNFSKIYPNG